MQNYFKKRAEELGFSDDNIVFHLAKLDVEVTANSVRNWLAGSATPSMEYVEPLAKVLGITKQKVLLEMHEASLNRKAMANASAD
jgi:hypothetical protein